MYFVLIGRDGKDEQALERRMAAREQHLETAKQMQQAGKLIYAGALIDDDKMEGSVMFFMMDNREELDNYLKTEPYVKGDVWREIEIKETKIPAMFLK